MGRSCSYTSSACWVAGSQASPGTPQPLRLSILQRGPLVAAHQPVQVDHAVQVVGLVLQAAGQEPAPLDLDRRPVDVHPGDPRPVRPAGREVLARHREAALLVVLRVGHASPGRSEVSSTGLTTTPRTRSRVSSSGQS